MPSISRILIYPIKALDAVSVSRATVLPGGPLAHDRALMLADDSGRPVNGKRRSEVHGIRASYDLTARTVTLSGKPPATKTQTFHMDAERPAIEAWCSHTLGFAVTLQEDTVLGFPDDSAASGPTFISVATLVEVASWFPGLTVEVIRARFRANIEIDGVPPFWEDRLVGRAGTGVPFRVGAVAFEGIDPCQRCIVPTRDPWTGESWPDFQKIFAARRQATLPDWAEPSRFNHFYRLTVNTRVSPLSAGGDIRVGDTVE